MADLSLVVLAAGLGSRYGGLKQIEPVGPHGELIVDYSIYDALRAGFRRVVLVINERIETAFRRRIGRTIERQCETVYVFQRLDDALPPGFHPPPDRRKPWGTAHAVLACREAVEANLAVINADDFYGRASYEMLYEHLSRAGEGEYCLVGFELRNTLSEHGPVARGICTVDRDGFLVEIHERTQVRPFGSAVKYRKGAGWATIPPGSIASLNLWGFTPGFLAELPARFARFLEERAADLDTAEFFLPEVVGDLVREGRARVRVLPTPERWFGVTYRPDRDRVRQAIRGLIRQGVYPENLWGTAQ